MQRPSSATYFTALHDIAICIAIVGPSKYKRIFYIVTDRTPVAKRTIDNGTRNQDVINLVTFSVDPLPLGSTVYSILVQVGRVGFDELMLL